MAETVRETIVIKPVKRRVQWPWWVGGGFLVVLAGCGIAAWWTARGYYSDYDRAVADAKRVGLTLDLKQLNGPPIPDDHNRALIYTQAAHLIEGPLKPYQDLLSEFRVGAYSPAELKAMAGAIKGLEPALRLVVREQRPDFRYPRDWSQHPFAIGLEDVSYKTLAKDLCRRASLHAEAGDAQGALDSLNCAYQLADDCATAPFLIETLVSDAISQVSNAEAESLLGRENGNPAFLAGLDQILREHSRLPDPRDTYSGELPLALFSASYLNVFNDAEFADDDQANGENSDSFMPPKATWIENLRNSFPGVQAEVKAKLIEGWVTGWSRFPADRSDWNGADSALNLMIDAVSNDKSVFNRAAQMTLPGMGNTGETLLGVEAANRMLRCSVRLFQLRNATGRLPSTLPTSLGTTAVDPFDGKLLRYRPSGKLFKIYSVGRDRVDDGGIARIPGQFSEHVDEVVDFGHPRPEAARPAAVPGIPGAPG